MTALRTLKTVSLRQAEHIVSNEDLGIYTLESPAETVITNFKKRTPSLLEQDLSLDEALRFMRKSHVRSAIVIDKGETFLGLLTLADLESRKVLSMADKMGLKRTDLCIADVMTPKAKLRGISIKEVMDARIGDMLQTLQDLGKPHVLLTDEGGNIAGVVSASEVARKLRIDINISERVTSFAEIYSVVSGAVEL